MRLFDAQIQHHPASYILQSLFAGIVLAVVLHFLNSATQGITIASLGATTFILFATPHRLLSRSRYVIGGYFVAGAVGLALAFVADRWPEAEANQMLLGGITVGLAMLAMTLTNTEHPPAAAFALGMAVAEDPLPENLRTSLWAVASVILLWGIKHIFKKSLRDLISS